MDDVDQEQENRRENLRRWVDAHGGQAAVARARCLTAAQASYLSQVLNGYSFGPRAARNWEARLNLEVRYLEQPADRSAESPHPPTPGVAQRLILDGQTVPFFNEEKVMSALNVDLFVYAVPDDAIGTELGRDALVVWQRSRAPRYGRPVLVQTAGQLHVRLYEQGRAPGQWIARATRPGFASFDSVVDGAVIVAALRGMLEPD